MTKDSRLRWRNCEPRFATRRNLDRQTFGGEIAAIAEALGTPLMPWQQLVADVGGEVLEDGSPAYREVVCTVPRQSGKTTLMLAWELHRALMWGTPQRVAYTAQTGQDARMKLIDDQYDSLIALSPLAATVRQAKRAMGATAIVFKNGSRIDALANSRDAGHGKTLGLAVIDEAMADEDDRREAAFSPTMVTVRDAQVLIFSTAGTDESTFLNRKVEQGRQAVTQGLETRTAYFEWSADDGVDPDDEDAWWDYMPALGHRIEPQIIRHERAKMSDGEFRRAYMNLRTVSDERVIPVEAWNRVVSEQVAPEPRVFAVDALVNRQWASIAVSDGSTVEVVKTDRGVGWVEQALVELWERFGAPVAIDEYGPVAHVIPALDAQGVGLVKYSGRQYANACASFFDKVIDGTIRVRRNTALEDAVAGARQRSLGDAWAWARRDNDTDISPLVAVTLAVDAASRPADVPDPGLVFAVLD